MRSLIGPKQVRNRRLVLEEFEDFFASLYTAHDGHLYVKEDYVVVVEVIMEHHADSLLAVLCYVNYVKVLLKYIAVCPKQKAIIIG